MIAVQAARYPSASAQDPMVSIARAIISVVPRRVEVDEKMHSVKTAVEKVRSYGAITTRTRESRLAELKNSISRPISLPNTNSPSMDGFASNSSESMDTRWSTQSWPCETTPLVQPSSAFEFDEQLSDASSSTCSEQSFINRPYSFF